MPHERKRHPMPSLVDRDPAGYLANPSGGYVPVPRELLDPGHPLAPARTGEPASKREALADLLAMAAWKDQHDRAHGVALAGTRWLAERWKWPRMRVHRFLTELHDNGTVSWCRGTKKGEPSRILIVGYRTLQYRNFGTGAIPPSRDASLGQLPPDNHAENPEPVGHPPGTPGWDGDRAPTKEEYTASHQKGDEGRGVPPDEEAEKKKEAATASDGPRASTAGDPPDDGRGPDAFDLSEQKRRKKKSGGRRGCFECGASIGPTTELCAKCAYGVPEEALT